MYIKKFNTNKKKHTHKRVSTKEELNMFLPLQSWHLPYKGLPKVVLSMTIVTATALLFQTLEITQTGSFQTNSVDRTSALKEPTTTSAQRPMADVFQVWCCDLLLCFPDTWRQRPWVASFDCWEDLILLRGALCPSECFFMKLLTRGSPSSNEGLWKPSLPLLSLRRGGGICTIKLPVLGPYSNF